MNEEFVLKNKINSVTPSELRNVSGTELCYPQIYKKIYKKNIAGTKIELAMSLIFI